MFKSSLSGLKNLNSDYVNNSYDMSTDNLTISGTLISPLTNLLSTSSNIIDSNFQTFKNNLLNVSHVNYDNKFNLLSTTTTNLDQKIELYENSNIITFNL